MTAIAVAVHLISCLPLAPQGRFQDSRANKCIVTEMKFTEIVTEIVTEIMPGQRHQNSSRVKAQASPSDKPKSPSMAIVRENLRVLMARLPNSRVSGIASSG